MSREDLEFVKTLFTGAADVDKETMLAALTELIPQICDPEIEWIEDPQRADGRVYHGHAGALESWKRWLEEWDEWGFEAEQFVDCGSDVLVVMREYARGASSGASVTSRNHLVFTLRDGKILRYREFYDKQAALDAVGLAELPPPG